MGKKDNQRNKKRKKTHNIINERNTLNATAAKSLRKGLGDVTCFFFSLISPSKCQGEIERRLLRGLGGFAGPSASR